VDEFFDAKSLLGSLQAAFASAMAASSYHSAAGGAGTSQSLGGGLHGSCGADLDLDAFTLHDLAASIREARRGAGVGKGGRQALEWWEKARVAAAGLQPGSASQRQAASPAPSSPPLQVSGEWGKQWRATLAAPSLTLSLVYPEEAGAPSPRYAPRLVVEALQLAAAAEASGCCAWRWLGVVPACRAGAE
jgi:hypothetical protein